MNSCVDPSGGAVPGLSRRGLLRRIAGVAGLSALGLPAGSVYAQGGRVVSLRAVMRQLSPDCDPSRGIRLMLPDDRPVISLRELIQRFYRG